MKLQAFAATMLAAGALAGGAAVAQVTMQPIPNPPEKAMTHKMSHKAMHKKSMKSDMAKPADTTMTPAPGAAVIRLSGSFAANDPDVQGGSAMAAGGSVITMGRPFGASSTPRQ